MPLGMGKNTKIAPGYVNTTGGDLAEVGSLDGGGNSITVNDDLNFVGNEIIDSPSIRGSTDYVVYKDGDTVNAVNTSGQIEYVCVNG